MPGTGRGYEWEQLTLPSSISAIYDICYVPEKGFITASNPILISSNGRDWQAAPASPGTISCIAYDHGMYIAAGYNGLIGISTDLQHWTTKSTGVYSSYMAILYANSTWVTVGNNGTIATSLDDGETWTTQVITFNGDYVVHFNELMYIAGTGFVAVCWTYSSSGAFIYTSVDGLTWNGITPTSDLMTAGATGICKGNEKFVAVQDYSFAVTQKSAYSHDLQTWYTGNIGTSYRYRDVSVGKDDSGNEQFVAVGRPSSGDGYIVSISGNGITWSHITDTQEVIWNRIAYVKGIYIVVGGVSTSSYGKIMVSGEFVPNESVSNFDFWNVEISESLEDYRNKQFVKGGWDYYYGDAVVNYMEYTDGIRDRQMTEGGSGVYGDIYKDDSEDTNVTEMIAESGTTSMNITITGHGLQVGDMVMNLSQHKKRRVSAVIDANNFLIDEEIISQASGDVIAIYPDANAICRNNIYKYGLIIPKKITFKTTALDFLPGTKLTVNLVAFGTTADEYYLIESVTIKDDDGVNLIASVSATQRDESEFNTQQSESWVDTFVKLGGNNKGNQIVEMTGDQAESLTYFTPGKYVAKKDDTLPVLLPDLVDGVSDLSDVIEKVNALIQSLTERQYLSDGTSVTGLKRVDIYKYI